MGLETWMPIPDYEDNYEVSDCGRVRSKERRSLQKGRWGSAMVSFPAKEMRQSTTPAGYKYVSLSLNGVSTKILVHRLVLLAFVGPSELQCNHIDGDKSNNHIQNLEYCTPGENLLHSTRVLRKRIGEANGCAKLTEQDVIKIRVDKRILREIAADYGVTLQAIHHVKTGKNWAAFGSCEQLPKMKKECQP